MERFLDAIAELYPDEMPGDAAGAAPAVREARQKEDTESVFGLLEVLEDPDASKDTRPMRSLHDNVLPPSDRRRLRLAVLGVIYEVGALLRATKGTLAAALLAPFVFIIILGVTGAQMHSRSAQALTAGGGSAEPEVRSILQFLANPYPNGSPHDLGGGPAAAGAGEAGLVKDVSYLLLSLLRRAPPPPGLFPALHDLTLSQPTTMAALVAARLLDGGGAAGGCGGDDDDEGRALGLRILTAYMSRLGAQLRPPPSGPPPSSAYGTIGAAASAMAASSQASAYAAQMARSRVSLLSARGGAASRFVFPVRLWAQLWARR